MAKITRTLTRTHTHAQQAKTRARVCYTRRRTRFNEVNTVTFQSRLMQTNQLWSHYERDLSWARTHTHKHTRTKRERECATERASLMMRADKQQQVAGISLLRSRLSWCSLSRSLGALRAYASLHAESFGFELNQVKLLGRVVAASVALEESRSWG